MQVVYGRNILNDDSSQAQTSRCPHNEKLYGLKRFAIFDNSPTLYLKNVFLRRNMATAGTTDNNREQVDEVNDRRRGDTERSDFEKML